MAVRGARPGALRAVLTRATLKELTKVGELATMYAKLFCPVDQGALRASIHYSIEGGSPETMSVRIGSNLDYALSVEEGHGPIVPTKPGGVLRFPVKGGRIVYTKRVRPVAAQPYLRPALKAVRAAA